MQGEDSALSDTEQEALYHVQLGIEHAHRSYGDLLSFHHQIGRVMDQMDDAEQLLRDAGHETYADELRDEHLPAGVVGDDWTYELVEAFRTGFLAAMSEFEEEIREELADGREHVMEREQQREWRKRGRGWETEE